MLHQSSGQAWWCHSHCALPTNTFSQLWYSFSLLGLGSGMRSTNGGADQSASATEQDRRKDARMWVLVSFGPQGSAEAKADESSDQSMAPVAWLPPRSSIARPTRISDLGRNQRCGSTSCKL